MASLRAAPQHVEPRVGGIEPPQSSNDHEHHTTSQDATNRLEQKSAQAKPTSIQALPSTIQSISTSASFTSTLDDNGTVLSSVDGKNLSSIGGKTPSTGEKSITSAATFGLDEKESLRPDDSASIAAEDDEQQNRAIQVDGMNGSDEGARAFREQLNEISAFQPLETGMPHEQVMYIPAEPITPMPLLLQQPPGALYEPFPDVKLVEALDNPRDRIWVLKLEQDIIDFVKDTKESSLILPQCNSFYRMLAHKIADYYMLGHSIDDSNSAVRLFKSSACRIPPPLTGVVTPSTAASTPPPSMQMKILRRGVENSGPAIANGSNMPSKSTSETGESEDDPRKPVTREEREARYEAARLRIMGAAKPVENAEAKDESRSSSMSRKGRKSRRNDSDDDFEARSAYNSYFTTSQGVPQYAQPAIQQNPYIQGYSQVASPIYAQFSAPPSGQYWYPPAAEADHWTQSQQYDLAREFDRSMTLQNPIPYSVPQSPYAQALQQMPAHQPWPQNQVSMNGAQSFPVSYDRPSSSTSQPTYAFGQLPSQVTGRPPNAMEHPLPGSYKSRHFNPQSQAFIPHGTTVPFRPFMPQRTMSGPTASPIITKTQATTAAPAHSPYGNGSRMTPQKHAASTSPSASKLQSPMTFPAYPQHGMITPQNNAASAPPYTSNAHVSSTYMYSSHETITPQRSTIPVPVSMSKIQPGMSSPADSQHSISKLTPQKLTHPLPRPVFASQAPPSNTLPPKPNTAPPTAISLSLTNSTNEKNDNTITKWKTPASLPAKPPRSEEQRLPEPDVPATNIRSEQRVKAAMPSFGSMPVGGSV